jgi:uncharacterized protein with HEPN domain
MREIVRDKSRLEHIIDAIDRAFEFTKDVTFEEYSTSTLLRFAVTKSVEIVGEASYKLSEKFRTQHPEIEWQDIIAMRHILVHGYYQTKDSIVWNTVKNYLPLLKEQIQTIYDNENNFAYE